MAKTSKKPSHNRTFGFVLLGIFLLCMLVALLLRGKDVVLLNPSGYIASEEHKLLIFSVSILLVLAIPTLVLFYSIAWKYRESNNKATYDPTPKRDRFLVFNIWFVPIIFMLLLTSIMWPATHKLAPQQSINNGVQPLTVQVIALRWKWLFIYPSQKIATVNFVQIPVGTPVQFELSADETPMSSFFIPHLAGQLYAMTGHVNQLNLIADKAGDYTGKAAEINGAGFAGMTFTTRASSLNDFNSWVQSVKQYKTTLTNEEYQNLLKPSEYNKAAFYSSADQSIYGTMLAKYGGSHGHEHTEHE